MNTKLFGIVNLLLIVAAVSLYSGATNYFQQDRTYSDNKLIQPPIGDGMNSYYGNEQIDLAVSATLTADETLQIALANSTVQEYLQNTDYDTAIYYDNYGTWIVTFYLFESILDVYIDDATATIIAIISYKDTWNEYNATLIAEAIAYVESAPLLSALATSNLIWDGYEYGEIISVYGSDINGTAWATVDLSIDAANEFTIIDVFASIPFGNPVHSFPEAENIALSSELGMNFTASVENYTMYSTLMYSEENYYYQVEFYEGLQYAYMADPTDPMGCFAPSAWLSIVIDDATGNIISSDGSTPANMSDSEVLALVLANQEIQAWVLQVPDYVSYIWYDGYGYWEISLYDNQSYYSYIYAEVDDATGEIVYVDAYLAQPAQLTEVEVLHIANTTDFGSFLTTYPDAIVYSWYDGAGTWYVSAYSAIYMEAYAEVMIDDATGTVLSYYTAEPAIPAILSLENVWNIVQASANYTAFMSTHDAVETSIYYFAGSWYVDLWDTVSFDGVSFVIDDASGTITAVYDGGWVSEPTCPPQL